MTIVITKPINNYPVSIYKHCGDTFRELVDLWHQHGLVEIEYSNSSPFCWWGNVGEVLLYDRPNLDWLNGFNKYNLGLFGNPQPPSNGSFNSSWIFWGRNPRQLHDYHEAFSTNTYKDRTISSIFLGKIENNIQNKYRDVSVWESCIEEFSCNVDNTTGTWKFTNQEYLEKLSFSKFGLCLRGFGPKCNREIELMGMGVVPLVTPDVDLAFYNPLKENVHYFSVETPQDVDRLVANTSEETWNVMSTACKTWYIENCSPVGSFVITNEIIERYKKPKSICTLCTNKNINDLNYLLKSLKQFEPDIPIILLCDYVVSSVVKTKGLMKNIHIVECLNDYIDKDRENMEKEGVWDTFMRFKLRCIDEALVRYKDTLYIDSDVMLLQPLPLVDTRKEIGLSPHGVKHDNCVKYGYYNAGYIYVNSTSFTTWWDKAIYTSKFYDQGCLEDSTKTFNYFEFDFSHNFGWWRLFECDNPNQVSKQFEVHPKHKHVTFKGKPLCSIHTHFIDTFPLTVKFNNFMNEKFKSCDTYYKQLHDKEDVQLVILVQYYNDTNNERQKEIDFCFKQNLQNKWVKQLIHFNENDTKLPLWLQNHPKFKCITDQKRLTFNNVFEYANTNLVNEMVCVCNADIFIHYKSNWTELHSFLTNNPLSVAALSRHEYDGTSVYKDPSLKKLHYANAQDAWVFVSPLKCLKDISFPLGTLGCDNAIAHRFVTSGYTPYNFGNNYKIIHYDVCRGKTGDNNVKFQNEHNPRSDAPETRGSYLLPEFESFDIKSLIDQLSLTKYEKYKFICEILSYKFKINNS